MVTKLRRDFAALEARRLQAARLFAQGETQGAVARALGVTTAAVNHWHHAWRAKGRRGLKAAGRAGRKPKLGPQQLTQIERTLRAGPGAQGFHTELWTLPRVATVIQRLTGVRHHPSHVGRLLQRLNWSRQRPGHRARERDEAATERWKTRRWAQVKTTRGAAGPGLSSRTKAGSPNSPSSGAPGRRAARRRS